MAGWYTWQGEILHLTLRVQPRASSDEIVGPYGDDCLKVRITAPPVDGKANQHLIGFLAKTFAVPRGQVTLLKGDFGRNKRFAIVAPKQLPDAARITPRD